MGNGVTSTLMGKLVIDCKFDKAGLFQEGLAAVGQKIPERSSVRLGFINTTGRLVIPFDFVDVRGGFSDGLAAVATQDKARPDYWFYGYIDHSGAWIIKPIYDDAQPFSEGLAAVCTINRNKHPAPLQPHTPPYHLKRSSKHFHSAGRHQINQNLGAEASPEGREAAESQMSAPWLTLN